MQIIISNGSNGKVKVNKLEIEVDKLFKAEIKTKMNEVMIFSSIDLMLNLASKFYVIAYNSETKTFLLTCLHFVDDQYKLFALLNLLVK